MGSAGSALMSKKARNPPGGGKIALGAATNGGGKSGSTQQSSEATQQQQALPDHGEVERLRAAAATEITTEEVKPIQTDFHFFVKEHIEAHRKLAEEQVRSGMEDESDELDPILVNTNLNTRLMKAWEALSKESRDAYMIQEEADRRRFMEDDEIASRHCATLTARGKSPRVVGSDNLKDGAQQEKTKKEPQDEENSISTKTISDKNEETSEKIKIEQTAKDQTKRSAPDSSGGPGDAGGIQGSPSKKNKVE